ncbi:MAG: hypothetical protein AVDCRST_MAG13-3035 [uncultured Solirubrobacteraceae bacterium]|uniref:DUF3817 domain-containing protein n=1 Tax=uncultured Solirubrobacteraceae bacterium TaxID=1162706 RepID=A0A6J4T6W4_9ACTN|nr:MAG: hypothetical protein AVDCRST_MAG13-3035 [uncultured Solirubrobacteraceae bacterium]
MPDVAATRRQLNLILIIGIADFLLLLVLLWASFTEREEAVSVLGPIHGVGFLALLFLCARGAGERRWGWWFPAIVLVTGGPIGSLVGDFALRRKLPAA